MICVVIKLYDQKNRTERLKHKWLLNTDAIIDVCLTATFLSQRKSLAEAGIVSYIHTFTLYQYFFKRREFMHKYRLNVIDKASDEPSLMTHSSVRG